MVDVLFDFSLDKMGERGELSDDRSQSLLVLVAVAFSYGSVDNGDGPGYRSYLVTCLFA